ncbi:BTB/POZ domain-containing protein 7-like [Pollicipes pollicipes]|uniref:BTB/POZ domain-containing protein 7-like n=1 Tax=Pollicipes pollicipes TaxID=41117 RepID=UPI0018850AF5|nr:BTB/POZ domain-containing protein 7-like [Pollicipes pollicipes]
MEAVIREYICDWPARDVRALNEEYRALGLMRELAQSAAAARPLASSCQQDLCELYQSRYCADVDLVYQGCVFSVHRSILSARCPYFRKLLKDQPRPGAPVPVRIRTAGVDPELLNALLQYLYCGELNCSGLLSAGAGRRRQLDVLAQLEAEFGAPAPLERDMKYLLETADLADALLVFRPAGGGAHDAHPHSFELPCHKAILSARSPFFKAFIDRRMKLSEAGGERARGKAPIRIELDETVLPRRYAYVLLRIMYMDTVDLSLILHSSSEPSVCRPISLVDEAVELYQIGRFVELDVLTQASEDLILEALCVESLPRILRWSAEPHGSQWVHRQALQFLCEEFSAVVCTPSLHELSLSQLAAVVSSDFVQASELEILQGIIRWSEHQLVRRMEEREPNLLSHTAHSVTKKGVKRRELSDAELREVMAPLLPHLRLDHLLPVDHDTVTAAIRRGLISIPPSHMIGEDTSSRARSWFRGKRKRGEYVRPRYFLPYVEEVKVRSAMLESHLGNEYGTGVFHYQHSVAATIPDALYMVDGEAHASAADADSSAGEDDIPVAPRADILSAMLQRQRELQASGLYQRASTCLLLTPARVRRQVGLQVVREYGLPDCMVRVLQEASRRSEGQLTVTQAGSRWRSTNDLPRHCLLTFPEPEPAQFRTLDLEALNLREPGHLSTMPDVALATGTLPRQRSLRQMRERELELDLGDGTRHYQSH